MNIKLKFSLIFGQLIIQIGTSVVAMHTQNYSLICLSEFNYFAMSLLFKNIANFIIGYKDLKICY